MRVDVSACGERQEAIAHKHVVAMLVANPTVLNDVYFFSVLSQVRKLREKLTRLTLITESTKNTDCAMNINAPTFTV